MQQTNNQKLVSSSSDHATNKLYSIIGLAVVLVLLIGGYLYYSNHTSKNTPTNSSQKKGAYPQTYSELNSFSLTGAKQGTGISFSKPTQYTLTVESQAKDQASFSNSLGGSTPAFLGAIHVMSLPSSTNLSSKQYISFLNTSFSSPGKDAYKSAVAPIEQFVTARFSPIYNVNYSSAKQLTTPSLKTGVWVLNLSASPKTNVQTSSEQSTPTDSSQIKPPVHSSAVVTENYKGQVLYVVGKSATYYFLAYSTDYNWDNNAATWQQVINSIKIDQ